MTGRVLLVCALCVLWCGACGGGCSETTPDLPAPQEIKSGNDNNHQSVNNNAGGAGEGGLSGEPVESQAAGVSVTELPGAGAATKLPGAETSPTAGTKKKKRRNGTRERRGG
ncbi:mucin-associated surface protein (MASP) [Trypanosoma cruzi]|nr:mucin-associated surface protein (MASP) [Trypanosoma cruzi]